MSPSFDPRASLPDFPRHDCPHFYDVPQRRISSNSALLRLADRSTSTIHSSIQPGTSRRHVVPPLDSSSSGLGSGRPLFSSFTETPPRRLSNDVEARCSSWNIDHRPRKWNGIGEFLFGSRIDKKLRNPANCREIGYGFRKVYPRYRFCFRLLGFAILSLVISLFHAHIGLRCGIPPPDHVGPVPGRSTNKSDEPNGPARQSSNWLFFAQAFVGGMSCFVLSQGHMSMRATRERMERVRQTAITMTYSLLKTMRPNPRLGYDSRRLQLVIYECLALTVAFPVALLQQILQNTYEPDITKYCQEAAVALQHLRGGTVQKFEPDEYRRASFTRPNGMSELVPVHHFFEILSLQLEKEYRTHLMRSKIPSMAPQHIIYNIRNHFENLVDEGNLDDRRAPIVRENIDMLALAGRECTVFSYRDVSPIVLLGLVDVSARLMAFTLPAQNCNWIINSTQYPNEKIMVPNFTTVAAIIGVSAISATILTLLDELWQMWDPFGKGINTFAWTLGVAREIDDMLNEYDEHEETSKFRKHSYMFSLDEDDDVGTRGFGKYFRTLTL